MNSQPTNRRKTLLLYLCSSVFICGSPLRAADEAAKPKVAVFPLAGGAPAEQREAIGFSLRAKLDRDGHYEPIDGPTMLELAGDKPVGLSATPDALAKLAHDEQPTVLIWGELNGKSLAIKMVDLRQAGAPPREIDRAINQPTDMRFVVEQVLQSLTGVKGFDHPVEEAVQNDARSQQLWAANPNLMVSGDFTKPNHWTALLRDQKYAVPILDAMPETDHVVILHRPDGKGGLQNVLTMDLSKDVAESNGLAALSDAIPIRPNARYRLQFKYRSAGPSLHVFVKGYRPGTDLAGQPAEVQCYERQVPPTGATGAKWRTVVCDLNPQNPGGGFPATLRVDLYAYLTPGVVMFDDVQLKDVGEPTRAAKDDAMRPVPSTGP